MELSSFHAASSEPDHVPRLLELAALGLLLCRYTGNDDVLIATILSRKVLTFVRFVYNRKLTVEHLVGLVGQEVADSLLHLDDLLPELEGGLNWRESFRTELFRFGFATCSWETREHREPPSMLFSVCRETIRLDYDSSLYPDDFAKQLLAHYGHLVSAMQTNPQAPVGSLNFLSVGDRSRLLTEFNQSDSPRGAETLLHNLFEEQARRRPDAIAIIFDGARISYRELNEKANRLAAFLSRDFGVNRGDRVAVLAGRSDLLIAALLGILKAGAAYVPVNPKHPRDLAARMIANCGATALVVDSGNTAAASGFAGQMFLLDIEFDDLPEVAGYFAQPVYGDDLAYAIYTSGSTGEPKAVAVTHSAIVNTILWRNAYYGIDESDVNLQNPSYAFDSSVVDIFGFLAAGAILVIPDEDLRLDTDYMGRLIATHRVSRMIATSTYYKLLHSGIPGATLRSVTVAGESTPPELVGGHFAHLPGVRLVNEYGPTENAVCSAGCDLAEGACTVPIGRPTWNVKIFILDDACMPVPIGVRGELFVAGEGLARGYLGAPALTAERFIPCPFLGPGSRMYRTGDQACWRSDGMIEFLGRHDNQVKIRGYRIELQEIESWLRRHPQVRDAVVLAKRRSGGDPYLAAYVTADTELRPDAVSEFVSRQLPEFMVPASLHVLPALPVNLNGKLDLRQLHERDDLTQTLAGPPRSPLEESLLGLCRRLLNRSGIGVDDNLFSAGATSLTVMEIVNSLRRDQGVSVQLADIYSHATVRQLAARISGAVQAPLTEDQLRRQ